jgi:hypothetical protein
VGKVSVFPFDGDALAGAQVNFDGLGIGDHAVSVSQKSVVRRPSAYVAAGFI